MKKVISMILTLALVLSMSITAFAAENTSQTVTGTYVADATEKAVYSVEVAWGSMEFVYEVPADVWNGTEHKYESGGDAKWTHSDGANMITVTNRSNVALDVAVTTNVTASDITASVDNGSFTLGSAAEGATTENPGEPTVGTASITLDGVLTDTAAKKKVIGSVTVTITDANAVALTESEVNAAIEALKNGETVTLNNVSDADHEAIVSAVDEAKDGALLYKSMSGLSTTYSVASSFADAVPLWTDGTTLTLLSDTPEYPENIDIEDKTVVLDLNGYKLSMSSTENRFINVKNTGTLTVRDTRGGGEYSSYNLGINVSGTLHIEGGTIENYVGTVSSGTINMSGGTLLGRYMNGSKEAVMGDGTFNMSGGTISAKYAVAKGKPSVVNISGNAVLNVTDALFYGDEGTATITGGTFNADPSQWVDLDAYTVTESGGLWTVTAK